MARDFQEYASRGAEPVGVSVDPPEVNAHLIRKLRLPFPLLSDPDGEGIIKALDAWNEHQDLAKPAIFVIAPDGEVVHRYVGRDFMDREPDDSEVIAALDELALGPHRPPDPRPADGHPSDRGRGVTVDFLYPYYRGIHFATKALAGRIEDPDARAEVERAHRQLTRYMEVVQELRRR